MRNGHEVIRGAMFDVADALEADDFTKAEAICVWTQLHRWQDLHKTNGRRRRQRRFVSEGPIRLLDQHCEQVVAKTDLRGQHDRLYKYEEDSR